MTSPTIKELLMRVIAVESPKLFDGSDNEPIEVTSYSYQEEGTRLCDTCDYPELLFIGYRTRGGETSNKRVGCIEQADIKKHARPRMIVAHPPANPPNRHHE